MVRMVLVADDSPAIQKRALVILKGEGFDVETVSNGVAAIKRLAVLHPAVILADVSMPGRDGYEVCEFVKRSVELSHVPVLLFASDMEPYDDARGQEVRADGVIKKPFEARELISMVAQFARRSEGTMSLVTATPTIPSAALEPGKQSAVPSGTPDGAPSLPQRTGLEAVTPEPVFVEEQSARAFQPASQTREFSTMIFRTPVEIGEPVWKDETIAGPPEHEATQPVAVEPQVEASFAFSRIPAGQPPEPMPSASGVSDISLDAFSLHEAAAGQVYSSSEAAEFVSVREAPSQAAPVEFAGAEAPIAEFAPVEVRYSARPEENPELVAAPVTAVFPGTEEPVGSSRIHSEAAADPPAFDWNLFYTVVHKAVVKMSPPPLPAEAVEEITRRLADEIATEIISESSHHPA